MLSELFAIGLGAGWLRSERSVYTTASLMSPLCADAPNFPAAANLNNF